jgi:2-succinyl-5-enolpyruvyl-6-hydroxy-3-cyclohexene-1-carboxylate synthase
MKSEEYIKKLYSRMYGIVNLFLAHQIRDVILSPGSRSALPALSFFRNDSFNSRVVLDERSAAYQAIGISLSTSNPCVLVCTSGTAAANYLPAVTEAYFSRIPLIVITADRPKEWIHQMDNQAIQQTNLFKEHTVWSGEIPISEEFPEVDWYINRLVNEALIFARKYKGPVHINLPIREPFNLDENIRIEPHAYSYINYSKTLEPVDLKNLEKPILLVGGRYYPNEKANKNLLKLLSIGDIDFYRDVLCNIGRNLEDIGLEQIESKKYNTLISIGNEIVSKKLKTLIREQSINKHIRISEDLNIVDTFKNLTHWVDKDFEDVEIKIKVDKIKNLKSNKEYVNNLDKEENICLEIIRELPEGCVLHLGNSSIVRHFDKLKSYIHHSIDAFGNRGTSGIDGSLSVALSYAISNQNKISVFLTGDLSFQYDNNALFNTNLPSNFKIIIINNGGGGVFERINSSKNRKELLEYFKYYHQQHFNKISEYYNLKYAKYQERIDIKELFYSNLNIVEILT